MQTALGRWVVRSRGRVCSSLGLGPDAGQHCSLPWSLSYLPVGGGREWQGLE